MSRVENREAVLQRLHEVLPELRERYAVTRLALYGSFARDAARPDSDVDLLVEAGRPLGLKFVTLAEELENALGREVHLATFEMLRRSLQEPRRRATALAVQESLTDVR